MPSGDLLRYPWLRSLCPDKTSLIDDNLFTGEKRQRVTVLPLMGEVYWKDLFFEAALRSSPVKSSFRGGFWSRTDLLSIDIFDELQIQKKAALQRCRRDPAR